MGGIIIFDVLQDLNNVIETMHSWIIYDEQYFNRVKPITMLIRTSDKLYEYEKEQISKYEGRDVAQLKD